MDKLTKTQRIHELERRVMELERQVKELQLKTLFIPNNPEFRYVPSVFSPQIEYPIVISNVQWRLTLQPEDEQVK